MLISTIGVLLAAALVILIALWAQSYSKKQREAREAAMRGLARQLDLQYVPIAESTGCLGLGATTFIDPFDMLISDTPKLLENFEGFSPFGRGSSRRIEHLLEGKKGDEQWTIFDYQYTISTGKSSTTHHFGIVAVTIPLVLPRLEIHPAGVLDKIGGWLGAKDIQFESDEFNREFTIHCSDERRAFEIIDPQMMDYLMGIPRYSIQFDGIYAVLTLDGIAEPEAFYHAAVDLQGFLQRIPGFVRQDIGFKPTGPSTPK